MASDFPRSPKLLKGALVTYQLPELLPTIIVFQYNPEQLTPEESISLTGAKL